jgi:hypothetical protein
MLCGAMKPRGLYKIGTGPRSVDAVLDPISRRERRVERIVESLRAEIVGGNGGVRIRRIFENPQELFRLEIELPEMGYQRTTLLDRDALEALLEADDVRARVRGELG